MPMRIGTPMPPLEGATEWVNGTPAAAEPAGQPTLVHFWSVSCHNCHELMPVVAQWRERYGAQGLRVVGVHQPRSEEDTDAESVKRAITEYGLKHPVAIDNELPIVDAWGNRFVPAFYLFDEEGKLRHFQAGERGQRMLEQAIERVLGAGRQAPG